MKIISKYGVIAIIMSVITGCVSSPSVPFEGSTNASQRLASDTYKTVAMYTKTQRCEKIEKIQTEIIEPPSGSLGARKSKERWLVFGCNKQFPYEVTFEEDGAGGAFFSVKKE